MRKETVMNITEREIDDPEKEGVILEYVKFTKEFAEIKEYVRSKGESIRGYTEKKECVSIRTEDILYFEAVQNKVFGQQAAQEQPRRFDVLCAGMAHGTSLPHSIKYA